MKQYLIGGPYGQFLTYAQAKKLLDELHQTQPGASWGIFKRENLKHKEK